MCNRLLCDFLRTGKRDVYMLLPCPSAPGSYSIEQQSGRDCNISISSRDWNWQWKEKRGNCPCFQWLGVLGRPTAVTWSMHPHHWRGQGKRSLSRELSKLLCTIAPMVYPQGLAWKAKGKSNCSNALVKLCSRLIKIYTGFECYCSEMVIRGNEKPPGETVKMTFCEPSGISTTPNPCIY